MSCVDRVFASFVSEMLMYAEFSVSSIQAHKDFTKIQFFLIGNKNSYKKMHKKRRLKLSFRQTSRFSLLFYISFLIESVMPVR